MSGKPRRDDRAQLALMDAMVFFAVCAVICGMMTAHLASLSLDAQVSAPGPMSVDELLMSFLGASVGREVVLEDLGMELTGLELFSETLSLVSATVVAGGQVDSFAELLTHCESVLSTMCSPWSSMLRMSSEDGGHWETLVEVGDAPPAGVDTWASSQSLGVWAGVPLTATLVLFPALVLHSLRV